MSLLMFNSNYSMSHRFARKSLTYKNIQNYLFTEVSTEVSMQKVQFQLVKTSSCLLSSLFVDERILESEPQWTLFSLWYLNQFKTFRSSTEHKVTPWHFTLMHILLDYVAVENCTSIGLCDLTSLLSLK